MGNTSSASIPILLDEWEKRKRLKAGDWIILSGFGGGAYLWGKPAEMADIEKKA